MNIEMQPVATEKYQMYKKSFTQ